MAGHPHDALAHDYNGEWAEADFTQAQPDAAAAPAATEPVAAKIVVSLRLSRDVVDHFRAAGPGWEARMEQALRRTAEAERDAAQQMGEEAQPPEFVSDGHEG